MTDSTTWSEWAGGLFLAILWAILVCVAMEQCDGPAEAKTRQVPIVYPAQEPTATEIKALIRLAVPQATGQGYQGRRLQSIYYTEVQLDEIARALLMAHHRYGVPVIFLMANLDVQSHYRYDAVSPTNDYGIAQLHCPKRGICRAKPTAQQREKLFDLTYSINAFGNWVDIWRTWCAKWASPKCKHNQRLTGIPSWIGQALSVTAVTIRVYMRWLEAMRWKELGVMEVAMRWKELES